MLQLFLFLHVIGAIAVFGPTFAFPIIVSQARKSPQNLPFAVVLNEYIERRLVIPGAIVQVKDLRDSGGVEIGATSPSPLSSTRISVSGVIFNDYNGNGQIDKAFASEQPTPVQP